MKNYWLQNKSLNRINAAIPEGYTLSFDTDGLLDCLIMRLSNNELTTQRAISQEWNTTDMIIWNINDMAESIRYAGGGR